MDFSSDYVESPAYFAQLYHSGQLIVVERYSSCKFKLILSISMYATNMPRSAASPSMTLYCLSVNCFISVGFINLFASGQVLANKEIVKVSQLCSYQNGYSSCKDE